jgi:hypothetical protein
MEPVGLVVGVAGLAGLFTTVLDAVDKVKDYRSFGKDSTALKAQFNGHCALLERWGRDIGLDNNEFSANHQAMLDSTTFQAAEKLLQIANTMLTSDESEGHGDRRIEDDRGMGRPIRRTTTTSSNSKRARIGWMFGGKSEKTDQVELFGRIVGQLLLLVPPEPSIERHQPAGDEKQIDPEKKIGLEKIDLGEQAIESTQIPGMTFSHPVYSRLTKHIDARPSLGEIHQIQKMMAAMVAEQKGNGTTSLHAAYC